MNQDIQFQIECLSSELVQMIMEHYGWDMMRALDALYESETFARLNDPKCGMYYQGAIYVFDFLKDEIETGKIA
ncbi:MAG: hypothetical protein K2H72_03420 [Muribaculaceae bacterium]|nr:hypothetical protein [Muribaculaceae bacterium]